MQLFPIREDVDQIARDLCDRHVSKICTEAAQIYNSALYIRGRDDYMFYKETHLNHPWVVWATDRAINMSFVGNLCLALGREFKRNRGKSHAAYDKMKAADKPPAYKSNIVSPIPNFPLVFDDKYKCEDPYKSYRNYYRQEKANQEWATWTNDKPEWITKEVV